MKIAVIGNSRLVRGFRLAGIQDTLVAVPGDEDEETIARWTHDPEFGILVIDSALKSSISRIHAALQVKKGAYPVMVILGPEGDAGDIAPVEAILLGHARGEQ